MDLIFFLLFCVLKEERKRVGSTVGPNIEKHKRPTNLSPVRPSSPANTAAAGNAKNPIHQLPMPPKRKTDFVLFRRETVEDLKVRSPELLSYQRAKTVSDLWGAMPEVEKEVSRSSAPFLALISLILVLIFLGLFTGNSEYCRCIDNEAGRCGKLTARSMIH
jgi:hypothetical protein